jgi:hypothetical protein
MNSGKVFIQELFEEGPISNIIPQRSRLETRTIMKQKGKAPVKEQVEKLVKNKPMSQGKRKPENATMDENGLQQTQMG